MKLVLGTENGIYLLDRKAKDSGIKPKKVLDCRAVTQVEVLEQHQILLVLTDKTLYSFSMEVLESDENPAAQSKRGRKIGHASFFKAGVCQGQQLVCVAKTSAMSSTIKVFEPMDTINKKSKKSGLAKMLTSNQDVLKPLKVCLFKSIQVDILTTSRNSISQRSLHRYTFFDLSFAWAVLVVLKLYH